MPAADAASDREALLQWLGLPADTPSGREPASIQLFCTESDDASSPALALPHAHGMLARLQRAFPGVVVTGAVVVAGEQIYCRAGSDASGGSSSSAAAGGGGAAGQAFSFCGAVICATADSADGSSTAEAGEAAAAAQQGDSAAAAAGSGGGGGGSGGGAAAPVVAALSVKGTQGVDLPAFDVLITPNIGHTRNDKHPFLGGERWGCGPASAESSAACSTLCPLLKQ